MSRLGSLEAGYLASLKTAQPTQELWLTSVALTQHLHLLVEWWQHHLVLLVQPAYVLLQLSNVEEGVVWHGGQKQAFCPDQLTSTAPTTTIALLADLRTHISLVK